MKIYNHNEKFGDGGPFEADSFDALADEMQPAFNDWANDQDPESEEEKQILILKMRIEFINGLEEIQ